MGDGGKGKFPHKTPPRLGGMTIWRGRGLSCVNIVRNERNGKSDEM